MAIACSHGAVRPIAPSCLALLACSWVASNLPAQWEEVPLAGTVPILSSSQMVAAPGGDVLILGRSTPANFENYLFDGSGWRPAGSPFAFFDAGLAYDPIRNEVLRFGGGLQAVGSAPVQLLQAFDGTRWRYILGATGTPSGRRTPAMAFDRRRGRTVLHGGRTLAGPSTETHEWTGTDWVSVASANVTPGFEREAMVYDEARQEMVLLGVLSPSGPVECWVYDGVDWRPRAAAVVPQFLLPLLAYDRARARVVARDAGSGPTAEWDGRAWTMSAASPPPLLGLAAMAYDERQRAVLLHGGNRSFVYMVQPQPSVVAFGSPCQDSRRLLRSAPGSTPTLGRTLRLEVDRAGNTDAAIGVFGFSRTGSALGPLPTPFPLQNPLQCLLRVDPVEFVLLPAADPAPWLLSVPSAPALLGATAQVQVGFLGATVSEATNGLALRVGLPILESSLREDFVSELARDASVSGDRWQGGVQAVRLGGDGRHGSFDPSIGVAISATTFELSTDAQVVPARLTLSGVDETVTSGVFAFTDFVIPAGITVRFRGANPVRLHVRGRIAIDGALDANAADMTTFLCRTPNTTFNFPVAGQAGGAGGPGGSRGGQGGDRSLGVGPDRAFDGRPGRDVVVPAAHAFAAQAIGTGGRGSPMWPAHGNARDTANPPMTGFVLGSGGLYNGNVNFGGSGGGYLAPGGVSASLPATASALIVLPPAPPPGGSSMPLFPIPAGASSLEHFLIGGSGGGGGGSHPIYQVRFFTATFTNDAYKAGGGGSGGGGAVLLRSGGACRIGSAGAVLVQGGRGALINGDNPATVSQDGMNVVTSWGIAAPGGAGSGGSVLIQAAAGIDHAGRIDASGGIGSRAAPVGPADSLFDVRGGDGAPGFYRLESQGPIAVGGTANVPAFQPAQQQGALLDREAQSGSRSVWLQPGTIAPPVYRRYELRVDLGGQTVTFSDDPARGVPANAAPVHLRFQAARLLPDGTVDTTSIGPWRDAVGHETAGLGIGHDAGDVFRFDLVLDSSLGVVPTVRSLEVYFQ